MRGLPLKSKELLQKARESALSAVEIYNNPLATFRSGSYIVLIVIAWAALLQSIFIKRHTSYYEKNNKGRYVYIDGEKKAWDITHCINEYFKEENDPMRKNLEFLVPLRNKLEHRGFLGLDEEIFGECQAALMNFEEIFNKEFPKEPQLQQNLVFAIQFSMNSPIQQQKAISRKMSPDLVSIKRYIDSYRESITNEQWNSQKYSFRIFLVPKIGNNPNTSDAAVEFIKYDPSKPEEMDKLQKVGVLIKEKVIEKVIEKKIIVPSQIIYNLKPGNVAKQVKENINKNFTITNHVKAWRYYKIRPAKDDTSIETDIKYCIFDKAHNDYVYSQNWVDFLSSELKNEKKYQEVIHFNGSSKRIF